MSSVVLLTLAIVFVALAASPYGASERERKLMVGFGVLLMTTAVFFLWRSASVLDTSGAAADSAPSARPVTNPCEGVRPKDGVDTCIVNASELWDYDHALELTPSALQRDASGPIEPLRPRPAERKGHIVMCRDGSLWCLAD